MATQVQKISAPRDGNSTTTLTLPNAVTAGNTIIVTVTAFVPNTASPANWTVSDNKNAGNYTRDNTITAQISAPAGETCSIYRMSSTLGSTGSNSFIVTLAATNGSGSSQCCVEEVSGLAASPVDQPGTNSAVSAVSNATCTASGANTAGSGYAVACLGLFGSDNPENITVGAPWFNNGVDQNGSTDNPSSCDAKVITSAETTSVSYTHVHTTQVGWVVALQTYKDAASQTASVAWMTA